MHTTFMLPYFDFSMALYCGRYNLLSLLFDLLPWRFSFCVSANGKYGLILSPISFSRVLFAALNGD